MSEPNGFQNPPHVFDQAPIDVPVELTQRDLVRKLRLAAEWFRGNPADKPAVHRKADHVGRLVIEAHAAGLIPPEQRELRDLIRFHTEPDGPVPAHVHAQYARCPSNLFRDIRGGGYVLAKAPAHVGGVWEQVPGSEFGGLMPRMFTGHLEQPQHERDAVTCDRLADLIEATARTDPPDGSTQGEYADGCFRLGHINLTRLGPLQQRLLVALWDVANGRPRAAREFDAVYREVYQTRGAADRDKFRSLMGNVNGRIRSAAKKCPGEGWWSAEFTSHGADTVRLAPVASRPSPVKPS